MNHQNRTPSGYPTPPPLDDSRRAGDAIDTGSLKKFFDSRFCGYCGRDFGKIESIAVCDPCDQINRRKKAEADQEDSQRKLASRMMHWGEKAGKFRHAEPVKLPLDCQRDLLERWQPGRKFGATITGEGCGKSWLLWLLLKKAWGQGHDVLCKTATEMRGEIMALARNGDTTPAIRALVKVPILAIDDFGLASPTPASDELWAKLLELRSKAERPTLIVSPYEGGALKTRFADPVAGKKITKILGTNHSWFLDTTKEKIYSPNI